MGATTPTYGLAYPSSTDSPDGAGQMQSLAQSVEAALTAQIGNTAPLTRTPAWTNGAGGVGLQIKTGTLTQTYKRLGRLVYVEHLWQKGSTTDNGTTFYVFDLPAVARSFFSLQAAARFTVNGALKFAQAYTNGTNSVIVVDYSGAGVGSGTGFVANDYISFSGLFLAAS